MDVTPQTTGVENTRLAVGRPVVRYVKREAFVNNQNHDFGTEQGHSATAAGEVDDDSSWNSPWLSRETYMLLGRALASHVPQLLPSEAAPTRRNLQAVLQSIEQEHGEKSHDQTPSGWVLVSKPTPENEDEPTMNANTSHAPPLEWKRLLAKRLDLMDRRVKVREARRRLREARIGMRDSDTQFERILRKVFESDTKYGLREVEEVYEQLQQSRESVRIQEDAYDVLEERLLSAEYEVRQLEGKVYGFSSSDTPQYSEHGQEADAYSSPFAPGAVIQDDGIDPSVSFERQNVDTTQLPAKVRLTRAMKKVRKLRRTMTRLNMESESIKQSVTIEDSSTMAKEERLRDVSEQRKDMEIQIMLLEEDAVVLEDFVFHQQDWLFSVDQFAGTTTTSSTDAKVLAVSAGSSDHDDLSLDAVGKPPPRHLAFRDLRTKSVSEAAQQQFWSDTSALSDPINSWLLQSVRASQFNVLRLREPISWKLPTMKPLQQERRAAQWWFSDGSELRYTKGKQQDKQSVDPVSSNTLSRNTNFIWESRVLSSKDSLASDDDTIIYYRSHTPVMSISSDEVGAKFIYRRHSVSDIIGTAMNAIYEQYEHYEGTAKHDHAIKSALDTRPKAIHYLLQMWNHPSFTWLAYAQPQRM